MIEMRWVREKDEKVLQYREGTATGSQMGGTLGAPVFHTYAWSEWKTVPEERT